jgi:hypothetical protein
MYLHYLRELTPFITCKAVAEWLTNNWRPKIPTARECSGTIRVSYLDIVCRKHADRMVARVKDEYNVEEFGWSEQPYFGQRLRIAKELYLILTEAEKEEVQQELKKVKEEGWDEETQKM